MRYGPGDRSDVVRTADRTQVHFDFFQLDAITQYLYLIVEATKMMKYPVFIFNAHVARQIPTSAINRREAAVCQFRLLKISTGKLDA